MEKTFIFVLFLFVSMQMNAQFIDVKARPLVFIFGTYPFAAEYKINENFGIDTELFGIRSQDRFGRNNGLNTKGLGGQIIGKYYPFPSKKKGLDRLSLGIYTKFSTTNSVSAISTIVSPPRLEQKLFSIGAHFDYKWVFKHNFLFEIGGGVGDFVGDSPYWLVNDQPFGTFTWEAFDFQNNLELTGRIAFGYRFGNNKNDD